MHFYWSYFSKLAPVAWHNNMCLTILIHHKISFYHPHSILRNILSISKGITLVIVIQQNLPRLQPIRTREYTE